MRNLARGLAPCAVLLIGLSAGCGSTPPAAAELSAVVGRDVQSLQDSYRALMRTYFDGLRARVNHFVDDEWAPEFLKGFIESGQLVARATQENPEHVLEDVHKWAAKAIERIEARRAELLAPIDRDETELAQAVDQAFGRVLRANATITAHLRSRSDLDAEQDRLLERLGLADVRDQLEKGLNKASQRADAAIQKVRVAEGMLDAASGASGGGG